MEITFSKDGLHYLTVQQVILRHPNTAFAPGFDPAELGYESILPVSIPACDPITQFVRRLDPVRRADGQMVAAWGVVALDQAAIDVNRARDAERRNAGIKSQIHEIEHMQGRAIREFALTGDSARLQGIEDRIAALRGQLE